MPVSSPGPEWCPEDGYGRHSGNWYGGEKCTACGQRGPAPDNYLWPGGSGPRWDEPARAETTETRIARYVAAIKDRDQLVKDLSADGWGPTKIKTAMGLSRSTIGRILGAGWMQHHGHGYRTAPRNVSHETAP